MTAVTTCCCTWSISRIRWTSGCSSSAMRTPPAPALLDDSRPLPGAVCQVDDPLRHAGTRQIANPLGAHRPTSGCGIAGSAGEGINAADDDDLRFEQAASSFEDRASRRCIAFGWSRATPSSPGGVGDPQAATRVPRRTLRIRRLNRHTSISRRSSVSRKTQRLRTT